MQRLKKKGFNLMSITPKLHAQKIACKVETLVSKFYSELCTMSILISGRGLVLERFSRHAQLRAQLHSEFHPFGSSTYSVSVKS